MMLSSRQIAFFFRGFILSGLLLLCAVQPNAGAEPSRQLKVTADFEGGSAEIKSVDAAAGVIHIYPSVQSGQGWPCWWYLRVDGLKTGQQMSLEVSPNPKPYRDKEVLSRAWSQPSRASISSDNLIWTQTPEYQRDGEVVSYQIEAPSETIWLAWGPPFLPSQTEDLLKKLEASLPSAKRFELARTRGNRPVRGISIGGGSEEQPAVYGVWVQARQHAWEAGASWVGRGFIEWAAGDDPAAVQLRSIATIHYIPIMDVDSVAVGAGGKDAIPRDHNRDWSEMPTYPEVAAAQKRIRALNEAKQLDLFLDLHNPGANEQQPYFFAPHNLHELPPIRQRNYDRWQAIAREVIRDPLPLEADYKFATYIKTKEEHDRVGSQWVCNHTADYVVSTTLETVWNTPYSMQSGYMTVGRQLAQSVTRYLLTNPRRE